jgi:hypothetical protein
MAIWQYDLFFIAEGNARPHLRDEGWDIPPLSAASTLSAQRSLVGLMGYPWLMMEDWVVFGSERGTRIDFIFDGPNEVEIHIRLDASATEQGVDAVCAFASELSGRLFDPISGAFLQPDRRSVASALATSRAVAFANSPRSFLSGLGANS